MDSQGILQNCLGVSYGRVGPSLYKDDPCPLSSSSSYTISFFEHDSNHDRVGSVDTNETSNVRLVVSYVSCRTQFCTRPLRSIMSLLSCKEGRVLSTMTDPGPPEQPGGHPPNLNWKVETGGKLVVFPTTGTGVLCSSVSWYVLGDSVDSFGLTFVS